MSVAFALMKGMVTLDSACSCKSIRLAICDSAGIQSTRKYASDEFRATGTDEIQFYVPESKDTVLEDVFTRIAVEDG